MHLMQDQDRAVAFLEAAIRPLTVASLLDPVRFWRQYVFVLRIWGLFTLTNFDQPRAIEAVQRLFRSKYQMAIDLLLDDGGRLGLLAPAKAMMRKALYAGLNWLSIGQWNKFARDIPLSPVPGGAPPTTGSSSRPMAWCSNRCWPNFFPIWSTCTMATWRGCRWSRARPSAP
jgi:hypothetical protein